MLNKVIVNANNIVNNVNYVKKSNPNSLICAMVKANAYGVGLKTVVETLSKHVDYFGVVNLREAIETGKYTNKKILIVGCLEKCGAVNRFSYACHCLDDVVFLAKLNKKICVHLKVNSGMNRYGFKDIFEFTEALKIIKNSQLVFEGLYTHFATTDNFVEKQMKIFKKFVKCCSLFEFKPLIHVDNSSVNHVKNHHKGMVRIGYDLYNACTKNLKPAVSIKTRVAQIQSCKKGELVGYNKLCVLTKDTDVAILPIGYADGFSLLFKDMELLIKNKPCKVLNVCMDCFMLDVTSLKIKKGDFVYILNKLNPLKNYSNHTGLSEYEIMCNFSSMRGDRLIFSHHKNKSDNT